MQYTTILFDADRTLFDFDRAEDEAFKAAMEAHAHPYSEEIKQLYIKINGNLWLALERGEITQEYLFAQRFTQFFRKLGIAEDGVQFNQEYMEHLGNGTCLIDGALPLCQKLHQHSRLYILTNGIAKVQKRRLGQSELAPYIEDIFVSDEIGSEKPDSASFQYAAQHIPNWDASRTLMVGDSLTSDIQGANLAQIDSCWFNPKQSSNPSSIIPTYEIQSLLDLSPIVFGK